MLLLSKPFEGREKSFLIFAIRCLFALFLDIQLEIISIQVGPALEVVVPLRLALEAVLSWRVGLVVVRQVLQVDLLLSSPFLIQLDSGVEFLLTHHFCVDVLQFLVLEVLGMQHVLVILALSLPVPHHSFLLLDLQHQQLLLPSHLSLQLRNMRYLRPQLLVHLPVGLHPRPRIVEFPSVKTLQKLVSTRPLFETINLRPFR
jgi:hypothetical protein